jgi:hypothetical protein
MRDLLDQNKLSKVGTGRDLSLFKVRCVQRVARGRRGRGMRSTPEKVKETTYSRQPLYLSLIVKRILSEVINN